ncbi:MAG TPA: hypothetical protein VG734_15305 [Lacunisphaera sp.]|nr:hypothetical protein [Lacunisphaera sp.]
MTTTNNPFIHCSGHNKLSALLTGPNFSLGSKAAKVLAGLWDFSVAEGFEDETGFHYIPVERKAEIRPASPDAAWQGEYI